MSLGPADDGTADKDGWTLVELVGGGPRSGSGFIPTGANLNEFEFRLTAMLRVCMWTMKKRLPILNRPPCNRRRNTCLF